MTDLGAGPPDQPFPGAHSQVPGAHAAPDDAAPGYLPVGMGQEPGQPWPRDAGRASPSQPHRAFLRLDAEVRPAGGGWSVRLPVRAEEVTVSRAVVVREQVVVRRASVAETVRVADQVRSERLRVETTGQPGEVAGVDGPASPADDRAAARDDPRGPAAGADPGR